MRVLVTGASGYTGTRLVRALLAEGHEVRALVHTPSKASALRAMGAQVRIGDLTERASIAGLATNMDAVYHLAGTLQGGTAGMRRVIVDGCRNLVDQCLIAGTSRSLRRFVLAGNAAVYGSGDGREQREDTCCRPSFPLGALCLEAEELVRRAQLEFGLPAVALRIGGIYGPGRLPSPQLREGRFRIVGLGQNHSSRIHVDDLVGALLALIHGGPSALYCMADEEPCTVDAYYRELATLLGVSMPRHMPAWAVLLRENARALAGRPAAGAGASTVGLFTMNQRLDSSLMRKELGLRLRYPSYREGLRSALAAETGHGIAMNSSATEAALPVEER